MTEKRKKIIAIAVVLFIFIAIFLVYKIANKSHLDVAKTLPEISVSASVLLEEFSNDEIVANNKYLDKIVQVNGKVLSKKIIEEKGVIALQTNDDFGSILCHFLPESSDKFSNLELGQNIKIKGICTGFLMDVILIKCEIIN